MITYLEDVETAPHRPAPTARRADESDIGSSRSDAFAPDAISGDKGCDSAERDGDDTAATATCELTDLDETGPTTCVRLCLLDGFALNCNGMLVELPLSAQRLLAFLAFHERPVLRPYVAGCLWTDKPEERANANLRAALWRLRQPGLHLVEAAGNHLAVARTLRIDVRDTFDKARRLLNHVPAAADDPELDALLLSGELLPDWYDDWVAVERERLRQLRLHALEALCVLLIERGKFAQAIDVALAAVAAEPLRESVHRALISAYVAEGNKAEAIRQYDAYSALLWDALGVSPSRHLVDLIESLRVPAASASRGGDRT